MKKEHLFAYLIFISATIIVSCNKNDIIDFNISEELIELSDNNKISDNLVHKYANARFGNTKGNTIKIDVVKKDIDTLAYIVNYGNGWELLAADDRYTPILAKGEGMYNLEELNPGQKVWLESELCNIKAVRDGILTIDSAEIKRNQNFWKKLNGPKSKTKAEGDPVEDNQYWELIDIQEVGGTITTSGHMLQTKWGQRYPWNTCTPLDPSTETRSAAGCVAVAGSQILHYLHYALNKPQEFYTSGSCEGYVDDCLRIFNNASVDAWDNMALTLYSDDATRYQSALLIGWVGWQVGLDYSANRSRGITENLRDVFSDLNITSSYGNYNNTIIWESLLNNMPIIVRADATVEYILGIPDYGNHHTWIIDGYQIAENQYRYTYVWTSQTDNHLYEYGETRVEIETEESRYIQMNWGYNGNGDDGFYYLGGDWYCPVNELTYQYRKEILYNFQ